MPSKPKLAFPSDVSDLLGAFEHERVDYLVVGGYAVAAHGRPRATKDLDLWVDGGDNLVRLARALAASGAPRRMVEGMVPRCMFERAPRADARTDVTDIPRHEIARTGSCRRTSVSRSTSA